MQGLASGVGTVLGTCIRIPCEVLKQRLQVSLAWLPTHQALGESSQPMQLHACSQRCLHLYLQRQTCLYMPPKSNYLALQIPIEARSGLCALDDCIGVALLTAVAVLKECKT